VAVLPWFARAAVAALIRRVLAGPAAVVRVEEFHFVFVAGAVGLVAKRERHPDLFELASYCARKRRRSSPATSGGASRASWSAWASRLRRAQCGRSCAGTGSRWHAGSAWSRRAILSGGSVGFSSPEAEDEKSDQRVCVGPFGRHLGNARRAAASSHPRTSSARSISSRSSGSLRSATWRRRSVAGTSSGDAWRRKRISSRVRPAR
jgi:hypothetical protein